MVPELRPVMPVDLFMAAIEGNSNVLLPRLGLQPEEPIETQVLTEEVDLAETSILNRLRQLNALSYPMVTTEATHSAPQQIKTEHQAVQSELQSATGFGDTVLHLLVSKCHNELALKVFQSDKSLLKARNKMLETPLHIAAKIGNDEVFQMLIRIDHAVVKNALEETNENNFIVENMLEVDPNLACTQFTCGLFPVHLAARNGNWRLVEYLVQYYPDYAELVDPHGRNLLHIAAAEGNYYIFYINKWRGDMEVRMNYAMDYEGNTPLHIAAMKGHRHTMRVIWQNRMNHVAETIQNNRGLTPYEVSRRQILEKSNEVGACAVFTNFRPRDDLW